MVIIEAMGTGLPIVATGVGGISDALVNEQNSILTTPDADEIANAMIRYAESEVLREKHGKEAVSGRIQAPAGHDDPFHLHPQGDFPAGADLQRQRRRGQAGL